MGRINTVQTGASSSLSKSYLLVIKKSIKFAISFSLFSFLVSYFSLVTLFLKPPETTSYFFAPQILDKSYMFLLCNGILVFLAKNSGLIGGDSSGDHFTKNGPTRSPEKTGGDADVSGTRFLIPAREDQETGPARSPPERDDVSGNGFSIPAGKGQETGPVRSPEKAGASRTGFLIPAREDQETGPFRSSPEKADVSEGGFLNLARGDQENGFLIGGDEEKETVTMMSAEELNKKCDEFIKKMKEGIKLESRQVVIVR